MITISLLGMDAYEAISITEKLHKKLIDIYGVDDDELEFYAPTSFIIHNGFEQTSFRLNVTVEAPFEEQDKEEEVKEAILVSLKDIAIHIRVLFTYFDKDHEYMHIDDTYPLHMSNSNTVKVDEHDHDDEDMDYEEEYEEPYMGDIISEFDEFIKAHPNASNKEVYEALSSIREDVTNKHHKDD